MSNEHIYIDVHDESSIELIDSTPLNPTLSWVQFIVAIVLSVVLGIVYGYVVLILSIVALMTVQDIHGLTINSLLLFTWGLGAFPILIASFCIGWIAIKRSGTYRHTYWQGLVWIIYAFPAWVCAGIPVWWS